MEVKDLEFLITNMKRLGIETREIEDYLEELISSSASKPPQEES